MCQGLIANSKAPTNPTQRLTTAPPKLLWYKNGDDTRKAEGRRTANSSSPKSHIEGTVNYIQLVEIKSPKLSAKSGKALPKRSLPVNKKE